MASVRKRAQIGLSEMAFRCLLARVDFLTSVCIPHYLCQKRRRRKKIVFQVRILIVLIPFVFLCNNSVNVRVWAIHFKNTFSHTAFAKLFI